MAFQNWCKRFLTWHRHFQPYGRRSCGIRVNFSTPDSPGACGGKSKKEWKKEWKTFRKSIKVILNRAANGLPNNFIRDRDDAISPLPSI